MDINEKAGERSNIRMHILWNGTIPFIVRGQDKKKDSASGLNTKETRKNSKQNHLDLTNNFFQSL